MKTCYKCKETKPLEAFSFLASGKYKGHCKACHRKYWRSSPAIRMAQKFRARLRKFGLTEKDYYELKEKQNNACLICRKADSRLVLDHNHVTNVFRGIICDNCNKGLGHFKESLSSLITAMQYLCRLDYKQELCYNNIEDQIFWTDLPTL